MRQAVALLCCLIVGLELVVGLGGLIGAACLLVYSGQALGPLRMAFHVGELQAGELQASQEAPLPALRPALPPGAAAAFAVSPDASSAAPRVNSVEPPVNIVPDLTPAPAEGAIVSLRGEQGGLLAGTVLGQSLSPAAEQDLFVGALRQAAAADVQAAPASDQSPAAEQPTSGLQPTSGQVESSAAIPTRQQAAQLAIERLYEMAELFERVGEFERADQWRALARDLRQTAKGENIVELHAGGQPATASPVRPAANAVELD